MTHNVLGAINLHNITLSLVFSKERGFILHNKKLTLDKDKEFICYNK